LVINALRAADIRFVLPTENHQLELGNIILKIKADEISQDTVSCFSEIIEMMHNKGATRFLLACTELPIIARYCENSNAFVDATLELAKEAILSCGYKIRDPGSVLPEKGL
jgi:aspartate/glutamate racemase